MNFAKTLQSIADNKKITPVEVNESDSEKQRLISNYERINKATQHTLVEYSDFMVSKQENLKDSDKDNKMNA